MIEQNKIDLASNAVRARAKLTRAFERGNFVLVAPHDSEKDLRLVEFKSGGLVLCSGFETGEPCKANHNGRYCYHVVSAKRRRKINAKRRATLAMKKAA